MPADLDLEKLEDSTFLLDVLLNCESVLDDLDLWCYLNWFEGEIAKGPVIRRHWVTFSVRYDHDKMPDPRAALRLLKHGIQVEFNTMKQKATGNVVTPDHEPKTPTDWLVTITIPRHLMDDINEADLEYDEDVDTDDVEDAKDVGLDNESQYQEDEQLPEDSADPAMAPPAAPPAPPAAPPQPPQQ
jgi:hypothetical protein